MEESKDGQPVGWKSYDLYPTTEGWDNRVVYDDTVAHTGKYSLKMAPDRGDNNFYSRPAGWIQENVVSNGANKTFKASAWVKASEPTKVRLCVYGYEPGWGTVVNGAMSPEFTITDQWQQISHENTFGPEVTQVDLVLIKQAQTSAGPKIDYKRTEYPDREIWFDDVEVKLLP